MNGLRGIALACLLGAIPAGAACAHAARPAAPGRPAVWRTYDMIVDLDNLPRTYTCDQLWYIFRGVLLRLGVPPDSVNILPYRCSRTPTGDLHSPRVQVSFRMPSVLHGAAVKWAQLSAVSHRVTLRPGAPPRLRPADCRLLRQIRQTLLASIPVHVVRSDLHCGAGASFGVTVQSWVARPG